MFKKSILLSVCLYVFLFMPFVSSCAHARPPKPGPNFVWVAPHRTADGMMVEGHWKYKGPERPGNAWVPRHRAPDGKWIPGHWKAVPQSKKNGVWVPGHHGPNGRWIPGHWR